MPARLTPLVFDDSTIAQFVTRTNAARIPPRVQLALVAWFVNDVHVDDINALYEWFSGFTACWAELPHEVH